MFMLIINFSPIVTFHWFYFVIQKHISSGGLYSNSHLIQNILFPTATFSSVPGSEGSYEFCNWSPWDHPHILNYASDSWVSTAFQVWEFGKVRGRSWGPEGGARKWRGDVMSLTRPGPKSSHPTVKAIDTGQPATHAPFLNHGIFHYPFLPSPAVLEITPFIGLPSPCPQPPTRPDTGVGDDGLWPAVLVFKGLSLPASFSSHH